MEHFYKDKKLMKTILLLTDFSENAKNAADIALDIAIKLDANILLLNSHLAPLPTLMTNDARILPEEDLAGLIKDFKADLAQEKMRLSSTLNTVTYKHSVKIMLTQGDIGNNVRSVVRRRNIDLVIMGGRGKPSNDFLFGYDTKEVIKKAGCPVLIIPPNIKAIRFELITFPTDLSLTDLKIVERLCKFFKTLKLHIVVTHVSKPVIIADFSEDDNVANFMSRLASLNQGNISFRNLRGDNIIAEIEKSNALLHADIMAIVYRKHSFLWNIFFQSRCKAIIDAQNLPLLIFPEA